MLLEEGTLPIDDPAARAAASKAMRRMHARAVRDGLAYERVGLAQRLDAAKGALDEATARHAVADGPAAVAIAAEALAEITVAHDALVARLAHLDAEVERAAKASDRDLAAERGWSA